jgi:hypothetical protein
MVRVPYRGVPKGEVKEEPKAPDPPIRKGETRGERPRGFLILRSGEPLR